MPDTTRPATSTPLRREVVERHFVAAGVGVSVETSTAWPARERFVALRWHGSAVAERRYAPTADAAHGMAEAMLAEASLGSAA